MMKLAFYQHCRVLVQNNLKLAVLLFLTGFSAHGFADSKSPSSHAMAVDQFDIFLIRHSEKQSGKDPKLTQCGQQRAEYLAKRLANKNIVAIYSTDTQRTLETAAPSANMRQQEVQYYSYKALAQLAKTLTQRQQTALVVGHSNTTPVLAGLLANKALAHLDEKQYNLLFQVTITTNGDENNANHNAILTVIEQDFHCKL